MKFKLKEDWYFGKNKILSKGDILEPNNEYKYEISYLGNSMILSLDDIEENPIFEKISEINLDIMEIPQDDEEKIGNWRIQLDVKTSRRKLKEIEKFIRNNINDML